MKLGNCDNHHTLLSQTAQCVKQLAKQKTAPYQQLTNQHFQQISLLIIISAVN